jgi:hypothetical protein
VCLITILLKEVNVQKIVLMLAVALVIAGNVGTTEAANRLQVIRSVAPRVINSVSKGAVKFGDGLSAFFWRNKGSITTGTALVTVARNPETFVNGTVALVNGTPAPVGEGGASGGGQIPFFRYALLSLLTLFVLYRLRLLPKIPAKTAAALLLVGAVILCCGATASAGTVSAVPCDAPGISPATWGKIFWAIFWIILSLPIPC